MFPSLGRLTAFLLPLLTLASYMHGQVIDPPAKDWILTPSSAAAGQAFDLSVLRHRYSCAHEYADQAIVVKDGRIDLTFSSTVNPAVLCAAVVKPHGPAFRMPALSEGKYTVYMNVITKSCAQDMCTRFVLMEPAGVLAVSGEGEIAYVIDPAQAEPDKEFTLKLLSPAFGCNIEYFRTASRVQDGKITLTFLDKANPLVKCAPLQKMYGPEYLLSGLKAGIYEVWAERLPACVEQGCKILPVSVPVAKLAVKPFVETRKGWFLKQRVVQAGSPFALSVVNNDYGNCNTSFDRTSLVVQDKVINVSFVMVSSPERVCVTDIRPHGPAFNVGAMKPGRYPVFVNVLPGCIFTEPRCLILPPEFPSEPSDTLLVSETLSMAGSSQSVKGLQASWRDGALRLQLPQGAKGQWRAEVLSLSGRRLHSAMVPAGADRGAAVLSGIPKPDRGIVLLRIVSPDRETHTVRVPVPD